MSSRPIIVMEMNELCPPLLEKWMADGSLPNFRAMHAESQIFETEADVETQNELEPWIQWYSVHTGLAYDQHGVFNLTDGKRAGHDDIFHALIAAGRTVANFSSMNARPFDAEGSVFLGDPWSEDGDAVPAELNIYNRFVSHNVREYSNSEAGLGAKDYADFLSFMMRRGLSAKTVADIVRQLASERLKGGHLSYRRVAILDRLQFDLFRHYYQDRKPDFATFFLNSTAHLQHSYWRHMEPERFEAKPDETERGKYADAVKFGYQAMDELVGRFRQMARARGALLVFQTALSQQPFLKQEGTGGQNFYRLRKADAFFTRLGLNQIATEPTMTHQYMLSFADNDARDRAIARLKALVLADGRRVFGVGPAKGAEAALYTGAQIWEKVADDLTYIDDTDGSTHRFADDFYRIDAIKSGGHHPIGCLWFQTGVHQVHSTRASILDTYPTFLDLMDVGAAAGAGDAARRGRSLVPDFGAVPAQLAA
ncbi:MAG: hypothetical protein AAF205_12670 [Pseudomonadota bacterium]